MDSETDHKCTCPVCLLVARDPHQTTCCGTLYCRDCLHGIQVTSNKCAVCRKTIANILPDTRASLQINALHIYCPNKPSGCDWKGEISNASKHQKLCEYEPIACSNGCNEKIANRNLQNHLANHCVQRRYKCRRCDLEDTYIHITGSHENTCPDRIIHCTKVGCGQAMKLKDTKNHAKTCPEAVVSCECGNEMKQKHLPTHQETCLQSLVTCSYGGVGCGDIVKRKHLKSHHHWHTNTRHVNIAVGKVYLFAALVLLVSLILYRYFTDSA